MIKKSSKAESTPMMEQWHRVKREHPDSMLFFRMGDFFELFHDDAKHAARDLGITLTARSKGEGAIPMAGVPVKSSETYLRKLIHAGHRVVICDQVQDPKQAKGLVERAVTRIVTAGTLTEEELLESHSANFLLAMHPQEDKWGLAYVDVSTGSFRVSWIESSILIDEVARLQPAEILLCESLQEHAILEDLKRVSGSPIAFAGSWTFDPRNAREALERHYEVSTLQGFGLDPEAPYITSAGAILQYLEETQKASSTHLDAPKVFDPGQNMFLDIPSRRCLELVKSAREGRNTGTLLWCLDRTVTALGARELKERILSPLRDLEPIRERLRACRELVDNRTLKDSLREHLKGIRDLERITAKAVLSRANARDLVSLRESLSRLPHLKESLQEATAKRLVGVNSRLDPMEDLREILEASLSDEPPITLKEGGMIREGYHQELDRLNKLRREGHTCLAELQQREIEATGIKSLKVGFNKVFGFYIEVSRAQGGAIPDTYIRKQTLKNAERFITPELKEHESQVLSADERAKDLEFELFEEVRQHVAKRASRLKEVARALAEVDALQSVATASRDQGFVEPSLIESGGIEIEEGRHPVLAAIIGRESFVPNDCFLGGEPTAPENTNPESENPEALETQTSSRDCARTVILTGPNMAGKSTYLRQTALVVIMAQMGCFVPAKAATLPIVDRVFTRVGASDDLVEGSSTFMVEMTETATILHNATSSSLVLLDEVGRGTSTFDGVSLAWAIAEHLHRHVKAMTLFATHYHQLMTLAEENPQLRNMNVAVKEWGQEIVFLHRIVEGGTDRSYGLHVAKLAGIPAAVIERARSILRQLENETPVPVVPRENEAAPGPRQLLLFEPPDERILDEIRALDPNAITPIEALQRLSSWKEMLDSPS